MSFVECFWIILQYLTTLIPYDSKSVPPNIDYLQIYVKSNVALWSSLVCLDICYRLMSVISV